MIDNKYKRIYDKLINKRKVDQLDKNECYCESHHILPRSLGGSDDPENLVNLTAREHYIAHRLLVKFTEGNDYYKMQWALHRIVHGKTEPLNSRQYNAFRIAWSNFLKENHPSKQNPEWITKVTEGVYKQWEDAVERREAQSERMNDLNAKRKENYDQYLKEQRERSKSGAQKSKEKTALRIEYNGETYLGWNDFKEATGISKHLYKKFYANGIDPAFRVGKDGVMTEQELVDTVANYCYNVGELVPVSKQDAIPLIERMVRVGLFSKSEAKRYIDSLPS